MNPAFAVLVFLVALCGCTAVETESEIRLSAPFQYSGYGSPTFDSYERESNYVPMSELFTVNWQRHLT